MNDLIREKTINSSGQLGIYFRGLVAVFDSRIIRRIICESILSTKMQKLLHCTEPDCLAGIMLLFLNKLTHNMQARPWSLVSILASCSISIRLENSQFLIFPRSSSAKYFYKMAAIAGPSCSEMGLNFQSKNCRVSLEYITRENWIVCIFHHTQRKN